MSDEQFSEFSKAQLRDVLKTCIIREALEPIAPEDALVSYLDAKRSEYQPTTITAHRSRLGQFIRWCDRNGITNLNDLTGRLLQEYRMWRRTNGGLAPASEKTQQDTLRVFIRWCESIEAVPRGLSEKVISPSLDRDDGRRSALLEHERTEQILAHLQLFEYASIEHVVWVFLCETGLRTGGLLAVDVDDYHPSADPPHIELKHRPESGTPIKNKYVGERHLSISPGTCDIFDDYLTFKHPSITDEYGREPFLASNQGRLSGSAIRKYVYKWTRPCVLGGGCPHDREIAECRAADSVDDASACPSARSPHAVRRGYITHELESGVPKFVVSERCSVSETVIDQHYDQRESKTRMRQRQEILGALHEDSAAYGRPHR